jgi:exodeoxyribonuclease V alpha subunit
MADQGHVFAARPELVAGVCELLEVPPELVVEGVEALHADGSVHQEALVYAESAAMATSETSVREEQAVYLTPFYYGEIGVTRHVEALVETSATRLHRFRTIDWDALLSQAALGSAVQLSVQQQEAVRTALTHKVTVLTGGPGTGKTVTVRTVIAALDRLSGRYALCAPTGRAAKRLSEATGRPAKTVHRLLEYSPQGGFRRNESNALNVDCLVVDEASMLDLLLTNHLLKAVDPSTHVLFVGDIDQLPSVGAGDVLRDIIASERAKVIRLRRYSDRQPIAELS